MLVNVKVFGGIKKFIPKKLSQINAPSKTSIKNLKNIIGIPKNYLIKYVVNGKLVNIDHVIKPNDYVFFIMIVGGG